MTSEPILACASDADHLARLAACYLYVADHPDEQEHIGDALNFACMRLEADRDALLARIVAVGIGEAEGDNA